VLDDADGLPIGLQVIGHRSTISACCAWPAPTRGFGHGRSHGRRREGVTVSFA
jgi:hypothetical protein